MVVSSTSHGLDGKGVRKQPLEYRQGETKGTLRARNEEMSKRYNRPSYVRVQGCLFRIWVIAVFYRCINNPKKALTCSGEGFTVWVLLCSKVSAAYFAVLPSGKSMLHKSNVSVSPASNFLTASMIAKGIVPP